MERSKIYLQHYLALPKVEMEETLALTETKKMQLCSIERLRVVAKATRRIKTNPINGTFT